MDSASLQRAVVAVSGATIANLIVLGIALATVGANGFDPFSVAPVALFTVLGASAGVLVHVGFHHVFDAGADRRFVLVAAIATVLSFVPLPWATGYDGATTVRLAILGGMHVVAAVVVVAALIDWGELVGN